MEPLNELLIRCGQHKDATAFQQLYKLASPRLFALCKRMMRDDALAEDILQEAFVKIWNKAPSFASGKGSAMTWMSTIARNQALDKLRMTKSRPLLADEGEYETLDFASDALTPDSLKELSDDTQRLLECMEALKSEQRETIMSAFYYGHTHDELATKMGKPLGTVKAWIRRGLEQLRGCLSVSL
uniref:RNA polymerase sigma-70 factor, ECF subfamily n=1 Tax=uncultured Thiotrichaceae bacterium TaxID=298394 RepID=A0A6S6UE17_9GAMM|nr:MAG: RNA polymerase sigma-70 factor, ECF subfamily [uncultured Thiotrichaceae bacterium]